MGFQDDYVMRTISDLVKAIARLFLGKDNVDYDLPTNEADDTEMDSRFRRLTALAEEGNITRRRTCSLRRWTRPTNSIWKWRWLSICI